MKKYLAVAMTAAAVLFVLEVSMERLFIARRQETAPAMAEETGAGEDERPEVYALFGVDTAEGDAGRSDCILLMSLDRGTVRMCSLARDTMVTIPGEGVETKLGHAYALGGPEKALETIRENFGLEVGDYVSVNFSQMAEIVELVGGVEVPLTQAEWRYLGLGEPYLGCKRLNGREALAYCRMRSIDNDDARTGRQRTLIASMLQKARSTPRARLPELIGQGMQMCRTSLSFGELLRLGKTALSQRDEIAVESMALPGDAVSAWGGIREDGVWYYVYDLGRASEVLREFFYGQQAQTVDGTL